jgi:hypothetical protein
MIRPSIGEYLWPEYLPLMSTRFLSVAAICGNRLALGKLDLSTLNFSVSGIRAARGGAHSEMQRTSYILNIKKASAGPAA